MTPDDIKATLDSLLANKILLSYPQLILFVILTGISAFLGTYLKQKAQGLATKEDIRAITLAAEEIKAKVSQKTALEQKILFDRYELVSKLEQGIIECATNINKWRQGKGQVSSGFVVDGDIVTLTAIYERLTYQRWLLGDSFFTILQSQANLLIEMANDQPLQHQAAHAARYLDLTNRFHNEMIATFATNKIIN